MSCARIGLQPIYPSGTVHDVSEEQRRDAGAGSSGKTADEASGAGQWVKGPARHAATLACALLIVVSLGYLIMALQPPKPFDSRTKLRASGEPIAAYNRPDGGERVHWVKPGTTVSLDRSNSIGPRAPTHLEADGAHYEVFIDEKDFDAEDLNRVREALRRAGY